MKMWTWSLSRKWKSIQKLDPVLKQSGLSSPPISIHFSVKLFQTGTHVPPFNIDGFETRNEKLVCNVLKKKIKLSYQVPTDLKVLLITSNAPFYSTVVNWFFKKVKFMNNE